MKDNKINIEYIVTLKMDNNIAVLENTPFVELDDERLKKIEAIIDYIDKQNEEYKETHNLFYECLEDDVMELINIIFSNSPCKDIVGGRNYCISRRSENSDKPRPKSYDIGEGTYGFLGDSYEGSGDLFRKDLANKEKFDSEIEKLLGKSCKTKSEEEERQKCISTLCDNYNEDLWESFNKIKIRLIAFKSARTIESFD